MSCSKPGLVPCPCKTRLNMSDSYTSPQSHSRLGMHFWIILAFHLQPLVWPEYYGSSFLLWPNASCSLAFSLLSSNLSSCRLSQPLPPRSPHPPDNLSCCWYIIALPVGPSFSISWSVILLVGSGISTPFTMVLFVLMLPGPLARQIS